MFRPWIPPLLVCALTLVAGCDRREAGSETASITPRGRLWMSRPRVATSASAASSVKTPDKQAAVYSPMLWPSMASGRTPRLPSREARAYSTTKSAGCVNCVRPSSPRGSSTHNSRMEYPRTRSASAVQSA